MLETEYLKSNKRKAVTYKEVSVTLPGDDVSTETLQARRNWQNNNNDNNNNNNNKYSK